MENNDQITALAREYAEEMIKGKPSEKLPNCLKNSMMAMNTEYIAEVFQWLTRRVSLVEKSKLGKDGLDIAWRAKEYDMVILSSDNVYYLFPDLGKEVEG